MSLFFIILGLLFNPMNIYRWWYIEYRNEFNLIGQENKVKAIKACAILVIGFWVLALICYLSF